MNPNPSRSQLCKKNLLNVVNEKKKTAIHVKKELLKLLWSDFYIKKIRTLKIQFVNFHVDKHIEIPHDFFKFILQGVVFVMKNSLAFSLIYQFIC
jgi:hypothetical protein